MNTNLNRAKKAKNDEFYTRLEDIAKELEYYKDHFKNKVVYCNCDDPRKSAFWKYFYSNFNELQIKKLVATFYSDSPFKATYEGSKVLINSITDGDFGSKECLSILDESNIVVTNPPFSLFRPFIESIISRNKKFLVIGSMNALKYKECFQYIMANKMWLGINNVHNFIQPDGSIKKFGNINWYTNMDFDKRHEPLVLTETYDPEKYPKYDTYDAIEVSKTTNIPKDYKGIMGVPISFMTKYSPDQFEIVGEFNHGSDSSFDLAKPVLDGKELYPRIAIKLK